MRTVVIGVVAANVDSLTLDERRIDGENTNRGAYVTAISFNLDDLRF